MVKAPEIPGVLAFSYVFRNRVACLKIAACGSSCAHPLQELPQAAIF
jgi:hypothetical protein